MSGAHSDVTPELRILAQAILDRLDPAVKAFALRAGSGDESKCQQVWCPVCALAALVSGEQHPMLSVIAEHSAALLAVVRAVTDVPAPGQPAPPSNPASPKDGSAPVGARPGADPEAPSPGRYEHIPVTVED